MMLRLVEMGNIEIIQEKKEIQVLAFQYSKHNECKQIKEMPEIVHKRRFISTFCRKKGTKTESCIAEIKNNQLWFKKLQSYLALVKSLTGFWMALYMFGSRRCELVYTYHSNISTWSRTKMMNWLNHTKTIVNYTMLTIFTL